MKKILLTITLITVTLLGMAQSPNLLNYQGVARNAAGNVIPNQLIALRLSINNLSAGGATVYSETRTVFTNAFGLFNVKMGDALGIISQTGTIAGINWTAFGAGSGAKYLQVEIDPNGGSSFTNVGSTQMLSVPYALNASGAAPVGPAGGDLTGTYPNPQILFPLIKTFNFPTSQLIGMTNSATTGTLGAITGTSASADVGANAISGTLTSTSTGALSAAIRGTNNATGVDGAGVLGSQNGGGFGVYGTTPNGIGVIGISTGVVPTSYGVKGQANTGIGVWGVSNTSNSGWFQNTNAANTAATVAVTTNGIGDGISSINTGTGRGGFFQVNNATSTANGLEVTTNGTGPSWGIRANSTGTNGAGLFVQSNAANTANNVLSNQAGLGRAGLFQNTNPLNTADALTATTVTTDPTPAAVHGVNGNAGITVGAKKGGWFETDNGVGVFGTSGAGSAGVFGVGNNTSAGVQALAFGTGAAFTGTSLGGRAIDVSLTTPNNSNVINATTSGNGNVVSASTTGAATGVAGLFNNTNAANTNYTAQIENANITNTAVNNATLRVGRGAILPNTFVLGNTSASVWGVNSNANGAGVQGSTSNGIGVAGVTFQGAALVGVAADAANGFGILTVGRRQFQGPDAANGKIFSATSVNGDGLWQTAAALGLVSGTGTVNFIPKWTPNSTTIGNSQIFDNGTNVGIGTVTPNHLLNIGGSNPADVQGVAVRGFSNFPPSWKGSAAFGYNTSTVIMGELFGVPTIGAHNSNLSAWANLSINPSQGALVGIGTQATPGGKVEIFENTVVSNPHLLLNENDNDFARLSFKNNQTNNFWSIAGYNSATNASERLNFYNNATGNLMSIAGGGQVGVGTTNQNASFKFSVHNNGALTGFPGVKSTNVATGETFTDGFYVGQDFANSAGPVDILNYENTDMNFFTNLSLRATIKNTGEFDFYNALRPNGNAGTLNQIMASNGPGVAPDWKNVTTVLSPFVWSTLGNAGTVDGTNFIGTTDNVPFNIRVNNQRAGRINPALSSNAFGYLASNVNVGFNNASFGQQALTSNTTGANNTTSGALSSAVNTAGNDNTANGYGALFNNTASQNTSVGSLSLSNNNTGTTNTAVGYGALNGSNGNGNTAVGSIALLGNTTGSNNTALGANANVSAGGLTNATAIGAGATVGASNSMVLGNGSINVGIGTSTPAQTLQVSKSPANPAMGGQIMLENGGIPSFANTVALDFVPIGYAFSSSIPGARLTAFDDGNFSSSLIFSSKIPGASGNALAERMRISSAGNVGINQNNPGASLDVNGTFKLTDGTQGAGKVLTSNATGNATWQLNKISIKAHGLPNTPLPAGFLNITGWQVIDHEENGPNYNGGTGQYNISQAGIYEIKVSVILANGNTTGNYALAGVSVNGIPQNDWQLKSFITGEIFPQVNYTTTMKLNANDKVNALVFSSGGGSIANDGGQGTNKFTVTYIH